MKITAKYAAMPHLITTSVEYMIQITHPVVLGPYLHKVSHMMSAVLKNYSNIEILSESIAYRLNDYDPSYSFNREDVTLVECNPLKPAEKEPHDFSAKGLKVLYHSKPFTSDGTTRYLMHIVAPIAMIAQFYEVKNELMNLISSDDNVESILKEVIKKYWKKNTEYVGLDKWFKECNMDDVEMEECDFLVPKG